MKAITAVAIAFGVLVTSGCWGLNISGAGSDSNSSASGTVPELPAFLPKLSLVAPPSGLVFGAPGDTIGFSVLAQFREPTVGIILHWTADEPAGRWIDSVTTSSDNGISTNRFVIPQGQTWQTCLHPWITYEVPNSHSAASLGLLVCPRTNSRSQ